jgi:hypothetical protein
MNDTRSRLSLGFTRYFLASVVIVNTALVQKIRCETNVLRDIGTDLGNIRARLK